MRVSMKDYIGRILQDLLEKINKTASMPATDYLFQVRDNAEAKALEEYRALEFHHAMAQWHFLNGRARHDIQTAVAFLTIRIKRQHD